MYSLIRVHSEKQKPLGILPERMSYMEAVTQLVWHMGHQGDTDMVTTERRHPSLGTAYLGAAGEKNGMSIAVSHNGVTNSSFRAKTICLFCYEWIFYIYMFSPFWGLFIKSDYQYFVQSFLYTYSLFLISMYLRGKERVGRCLSGPDSQTPKGLPNLTLGSSRLGDVWLLYACTNS